MCDDESLSFFFEADFQFLFFLPRKLEHLFKKMLYQKNIQFGSFLF